MATYIAHDVRQAFLVIMLPFPRQLEMFQELNKVDGAHTHGGPKYYRKLPNLYTQNDKLLKLGELFDFLTGRDGTGDS